MKRDLLTILACPEDKAPMELAVTKEGEGDEEGNEGVVEGTLTCTRCGFAYPIEQGIPNLLPPAMHVDGVSDAE